MVILQFNKLIRNKWLWGVFAVIVGGAFAFDFLVDDLLRDGKRETNDSGVGTLGGKPVSSAEFRAIAEEVRGFGQNRDWRRSNAEVNREAWEMTALLEVARRNGVEATDSEVAQAIRNDRSFQQNGQFSFAMYQALLRENGLSPERFEEFLKRRLTAMKVAGSVLSGSASWASPMEIEQAVADMTDSYTVRVARFKQDKAEADAVKLDDEGLKKWYDENSKSLDLPERMKLRLVKFDAATSNALAAVTVTEDALRDHYDVTVDKYTSTDTNGVETVKKFEDVRAEVEKEVRLIESVQCLTTGLVWRVNGVKAAEGKSRLDEIAAEEGLKVETSEWFSLEGPYKDGFMKRATLICPGAKGFEEVVAELDSSSEDLRYGVVASDKAVWLVEKAETSAAHVPTFEEAKEIVRPRALAAAKADAFKDKVEAVIAKGVKAVAESGNVSTNITFAVCDLKQGDFPDQNAIVSAAMKLRKGEISKFTPTGTGRALVVICEDRVPGDAAKAQIWKLQVRSEVEALQSRQVPESWKKWNLDRLGFEPGEGASVVDAEIEE
ncbi:MAG: SurA N-terminal domain-containing protein [Kiritimatiellae bacterium]|nr:SurA N-terminal domain-containing protein [Kiritimatiellia bacterium]